MAIKTLQVTSTEKSCNDGCCQCSTVLLIPFNPAVLAPGVGYIKAATVGSGQSCNGKCYWTVTYDDSLQASPSQQLTQNDFRCIKCFSCSDLFAEIVASVGGTFLTNAECPAGYFVGAPV